VISELLRAKSIINGTMQDVADLSSWTARCVARLCTKEGSDGGTDPAEVINRLSRYIGAWNIGSQDGSVSRKRQGNLSKKSKPLRRSLRIPRSQIGHAQDAKTNQAPDLPGSANRSNTKPDHHIEAAKSKLTDDSDRTRVSAARSSTQSQNHPVANLPSGGDPVAVLTLPSSGARRGGALVEKIILPARGLETLPGSPGWIGEKGPRDPQPDGSTSRRKRQEVWKGINRILKHEGMLQAKIDVKRRHFEECQAHLNCVYAA